MKTTGKLPKIPGRRITILIRTDPAYWNIVKKQFPDSTNQERIRKLVDRLLTGKER